MVKYLPHINKQTDLSFFITGIPVTDKPDSVLVGLAPDKFNYELLNDAFRYVASCLTSLNCCPYKLSVNLTLGRL